MNIQTINIGSTPNDGTGDTLRTAMSKANSNIAELADFATEVDSKVEGIFFDGTNLYDDTAATPDKFMGSNGILKDGETYTLSDYIPVEEGKDYVANKDTRFFATFADDQGTVVPEYGSNDLIADGDYISIPLSSGVSFIRVSVQKTTSSGYILEEVFPAQLVGNRTKVIDDSFALNWSGLKAATYGDSITAQEYWQPHFTARAGLDHTAFGVGGRTISDDTDCMAVQTQINTINNNPDVIFVMGGVNDWAQNTALGSVDSTDITEFCGGLNLMYERLLTTFPNARIIAMTPSYGEFLNDGADRGWTSGITNPLGYSTREYAQSVRDVAARWSLPVIDVAANEGVNTVNIATYRKNDGALLHPNDDGGKRIAEVVLSFLRSFQPKIGRAHV